MLPVFLVLIFTFIFSSVSFYMIHQRNKVEIDGETVEKKLSVIESFKEKNILKEITSFYSNLNKKQWIILTVCFLLQCLLTIRTNSLLSNPIDLFKILSLAVVLLSASIVDLYIKKIPNIYPILVLIIRGCLIIVEVIFKPSTALKSTIISLVGLLISFLILLLLKLIAKGGFGMGDVKLLSVSCALVGMLTTLYTFTIAMFICMVVSIFLMVTKKRGSKDEIPFGPFIYIGYFVTVMLGTLG